MSRKLRPFDSHLPDQGVKSAKGLAQLKSGPVVTLLAI